MKAVGLKCKRGTPRGPGACTKCIPAAAPRRVPRGPRTLLHTYQVAPGLGHAHGGRGFWPKDRGAVPAMHLDEAGRVEALAKGMRISCFCLVSKGHPSRCKLHSAMLGSSAWIGLHTSLPVQQTWPRSWQTISAFGRLILSKPGWHLKSSREEVTRITALRR